MTALPKSAEAVIVGGGINGASIAYHLAVRGMSDIVVLEAVKVAHGASSRGAGIIRTFYANDSEARLAIASLETFRHWKEEIGGTSGYRPTGFLWMVGPDAVRSLTTTVDRQNEFGARSEVLAARDVAELQPHIDPDGIAAAAYEPMSGYGSPAQATAALHAAAARLGAMLYEGLEVRAIRTRSGRVAGVSTAEGDIASPLVILAAGAWSAPLAKSVGVTLPLTTIRMTTGTIRHGPFERSPLTFIDTTTDTFFRPGEEPGVAHVSIRDRRHNTVLDANDDWAHEVIDAAASLDGIARLRTRLPSLSATPLAAWVGPDGVTPDKRAIYGNVAGLDGLVLCVGGNYKGFKVAPAVGRSIAELVVDGSSSIDLSPFALDRFASAQHTAGPGSYSLADVA